MNETPGATLAPGSCRDAVGERSPPAQFQHAEACIDPIAHSKPHGAKRVRSEPAERPRAWLLPANASARWSSHPSPCSRWPGRAVLLAPFVPALAWALAIGVVIEPLHAALARRLRWRNVTAGLCVVGTAAACWGLPWPSATPRSGNSPTWQSDSEVAARAQAWRDTVRRLPMGQGVADWISRRVDVDREWPPSRRRWQTGPPRC